MTSDLNRNTSRVLRLLEHVSWQARKPTQIEVYSTAPRPADVDFHLPPQTKLSPMRSSTTSVVDARKVPYSAMQLTGDFVDRQETDGPLKILRRVLYEFNNWPITKTGRAPESARRD